MLTFRPQCGASRGSRRRSARRLTSTRNLLLILDNARDSRQVRPLLPAGPGCAVVVTSRQVLTAINGAGHPSLTGLDESASPALLARIARALVCWDRAGRLAEAEAGYRRSAALYRKAGHRALEGVSLWGLGDALRDLGRPDEARECRHRSARILRDVHLLTEEELTDLLAQDDPAPPDAVTRFQPVVAVQVKVSPG
ncbi:tetratricopeptide repeat protein, partial [Nonomuraea sp. NPDC004297]